MSFIEDPRAVAANLSVRAALAGHGARLLEIVQQSRALIGGHFRLQGQGHSPVYLRFRQIGREPAWVTDVATILLDSLPRMATFSKVLAPESAGYHLGRAVADVAGVELAVAKIDMARRPARELRSGTIDRGDYVLVVNDVVATGGSLEALREAVTAQGGHVAGLIVFATLVETAFDALATRWGGPAHAACAGRWAIYPKGVGCPMCAAGQELVPGLELN